MADNCDPRKIDSNVVGLSFAETICGRLPTMALDGYLPTWYEREPNTYSDFGGEITTMARNPINASRQRKKGTTVDLDASGGFNEDFTQNNETRLLQGFFFADIHEKATTKPLNAVASDFVVVTGAVAASDSFTAASGLDRFRVNQLVKVSGFATAANNGMFKVATVAAGLLGITGALVDEAAPAGVVIEAVGFQLANGGASMVLQGNLGVLTLATNPVEAAGTVTFAAIAAAGDEVDIGGVSYMFATVPDADYEIPIGVDDDASAFNLAAAINGNVLGTPAHPLVSAVAATNVVTLTAKIAGTSGNAIALVTTGADITVSGATMTGGTGFSLKELGLILGEWVYLGGDAAANHFVDGFGAAVNTGYARVATIADQTILFDKTTFAPVANAGAGKDFRVFVGNTLRNEKDPNLIVTRYYEFERTLGLDANGVQTEYLPLSVANEATLNIPLGDKLNVDVTVIAGDAEQRTGAEGRKPGPFQAALGEDAYNTSSDVVRIRMAVLDPATSRPTSLFAYITEGTISINNGVTPVKVIGKLGAIDVSSGTFEVGGELTAIFSTVAATRAVRNNADVTIDMIVAARNEGFVWDIPLLSLGGGRINVDPGNPITVPLEMSGAENPNGYTLLYTNFPYLPTLAMPVVGAVY